VTGVDPGPLTPASAAGRQSQPEDTQGEEDPDDGHPDDLAHINRLSRL